MGIVDRSARRPGDRVLKMADPATMPRVLLAQPFMPGNVTVRQVPSTLHRTSPANESIEAQWQRMTAAPGLQLFDGPMCRLEVFHVEHLPNGRSRLRLDVSLTSYKVFLGTNLHGPRSLPASACANPIGVSPALESSDGFLLFGRRGDKVAYYPRRFHPFSGALEPSDGPDGPDIFEECRRELQEELGLDADAIACVRLLGIVEDEAIRHPELILHVRSTLTKTEILRGLDPAEHDGAQAVPATTQGVAQALRDKRFTPVGRAVLALWRDAPP